MSIGLLLIFLCAITVVFFLILRRKGRKSEVIPFLSTTLATLIGVLLAVTLSDIQTKKNETEDTIKLLKSAKSTLNLNYEYSKGLVESFNYLKSSDSISENYSLPYPDLYEKIIQNDVVSKNISEHSLFQINNVLINLKRIPNSDKLDHELFLKELKRLLHTTSLEIDYQKGNLTLKELELKLDEKLNEVHNLKANNTNP